MREIEGGACRLCRPRGVSAGRRTKEDDGEGPDAAADLQALVESTTRGDPESPLLWTARSQRNLVAALGRQGHQTSMKTVARLLQDRLQPAGQPQAPGGRSHPDRNAQFEHIDKTIRRQPARDAGHLRGHEEEGTGRGRTRTAGGNCAPTAIPKRSTCMTSSTRTGKVAPYGVYDLQKNKAWVSVGINHDTAEFAVETVRSWWQEMGASAYPAGHLAGDHGGWRRQQRLSAAAVEARTASASSTRSASRLPCVICRRGPASGTRSSTACSPSSRRTGAADR